MEIRASVQNLTEVQMTVFVEQVNFPGQGLWDAEIEVRKVRKPGEQDDFAVLSRTIARNYLTFQSWLERLIEYDSELAKKAEEHLRNVQKLIDGGKI